ncbi:hypothetical protein Y1Q_0005455 [Alligator mississippiensis]|uniref:Uncharacterized protein n=1 Tax=Alligator mississippiensis TaxID=8496 RepID=A0A151MEL7_ALLMI|nr:hypothetical protein Y1Q_0005455 [Alligator mississippiensis]
MANTGGKYQQITNGNCRGESMGKYTGEALRHQNHFYFGPGSQLRVPFAGLLAIHSHLESSEIHTLSSGPFHDQI